MFKIYVGNDENKIFIYSKKLADKLKSCKKNQPLTFESYLTKTEKGKAIERIRVHELKETPSNSQTTSETLKQETPAQPIQTNLPFDFDFAGVYAETVLELKGAYSERNIDMNGSFYQSVTSVFIAKTQNGIIIRVFHLAKKG